ncbi:unnamed protein product [Colias eurytheme]|nr:unnamed protein product [Colias eurytheme]
MYTLADLDTIFTENHDSLQTYPLGQHDMFEPSLMDTHDSLGLGLMEPDEILKDVILPPTFDRNNIYDVQGMVDDGFLEVDDMPRDDLLDGDEFDVSKFFNLPDDAKREPNKEPE